MAPNTTPPERTIRRKGRLAGHRHNKRMSEEVKQRMKQMFLDKVPNTEVAERTGYSLNSVERFKAKLRLTTKPRVVDDHAVRSLFLQGWTTREIMAEMNLGQHAVLAVRKTIPEYIHKDVVPRRMRDSVRAALAVFEDAPLTVVQVADATKLHMVRVRDLMAYGEGHGLVQRAEPVGRMVTFAITLKGKQMLEDLNATTKEGYASVQEAA